MQFFDTSSLLTSLPADARNAAISSVTIGELESIKTDYRKDPDVKARAREAVRYLKDHSSEIRIVPFVDFFVTKYDLSGTDLTNDIKILACALALKDEVKDVTLYTEDLLLQKFAEVYNLPCASVNSIAEKDDYCGFVERKLSDDELNTLYSDMSTNSQNLLINEYLIVRGDDDTIVDCLCWDGNRYRKISYHPFSSSYFGEAKPVSGDVYQRLAFDALLHSQITLLTGPAGAGKDYAGLSYAMSEIESGRRKKLIVFGNPVPARGAQTIGFLKGDLKDKILDCSVGNILRSKLGGRQAVERLWDTGKLEVLPFSDIRGFDTTGQNAIVYITEAQNLSVDLMKLAVQRIGDDCQMVLNGDVNTQLDLDVYKGPNNGIRRLSKVFRGYEEFSQVELKLIHRSHVAEIAEKM